MITSKFDNFDSAQKSKKIFDIKEIKCKNCMTKSKLTDYVINPYTGCEHGCRYCYADFMRRFQNIKENWGDFVYAKINCPELLAQELEKNKPGHIWLSSVCDCYMPIESRFKLTRKILEIISNSKFKNKFTIEILTKSALVRRDFDLLKKLNIELGMSINTINDDIARIIEPLASPPSLRIETLRLAKNNGIKVFGFISPVIPGITKLNEIFSKLEFVDYVWVELLNTKKSVLDRLIPLIKQKFPQAMKDFDFAISNPNEYYKKIEKEIRELEKKHKIKVREIVRHDLKMKS